MTDYFAPVPGEVNPNTISALGLAHIGDGVFELMVRAYLCRQGGLTAGELHKKTVGIVAAPAQAAAMKKIEPALTEEEHDVFRRGRNAKVHSTPQHATLAEYHAATGLETLFGWLYLKGNTQRLNELFAIITED